MTPLQYTSNVTVNEMEHSPAVHRPMKVCACLLTRSTPRLMGSLRRICPTKSKGVTAAKSHFNVFRTRSSQFYRRKNYNGNQSPILLSNIKQNCQRKNNGNCHYKRKKQVSNSIQSSKSIRFF